MKVYVWILKKKMYMLTNLWQNILCKAQYLKLQYFWFLKQGQKKKKNISEGLQNIRLALHQGPVQTGVQHRPVLLCSHVMSCRKLSGCTTGSGRAQCAFSRTQTCIEDCWRVGERDDCGGRAAATQQPERNLPPAATRPPNKRSASRPSSSSDVSTLCRTESCSILKVSTVSHFFYASVVFLLFGSRLFSFLSRLPHTRTAFFLALS